MNSLLHHLSQHTARGDAIPAAEAFVLLTLGFFGGMVVAVAFAAWVLYRRSTRPKPHRQLLLEMEEEEPKNPAETRAQESRKPWEQDADWWKTEGR